MTTPTFVPSSEQQKVIAHRGGHPQAVACAGAGKTEAISRRVSTLIEGGVEPAQIVAFTFTERVASRHNYRQSGRRMTRPDGRAARRPESGIPAPIFALKTEVQACSRSSVSACKRSSSYS
jgi:superfamily I DNA/RNA helicase